MKSVYLFLVLRLVSVPLPLIARPDPGELTHQRTAAVMVILGIRHLLHHQLYLMGSEHLLQHTVGPQATISSGQHRDGAFLLCHLTKNA